jgi:hypothetical protein
LQTTDIAYSLRSNPELPSQEVPATLSPTQISRAHLNIGWKMHLPQNQRPQISSQGQRNKPLQLPQKILSRVIFLLQSWEPLDLAVPHASSTATLHSTQTSSIPILSSRRLLLFLPQTSETAFWNAKEDFGYGAEVGAPW